MIRLVAFLLLLVLGSAAWADSWAPPSKTIYRSPDRATRLIVTPRRLESASAYFEDKVEGREPAGAAAGCAARAPPPSWSGAARPAGGKGSGPGRWTMRWRR